MEVACCEKENGGENIGKDICFKHTLSKAIGLQVIRLYFTWLHYSLTSYKDSCNEG